MRRQCKKRSAHRLGIIISLKEITSQFCQQTDMLLILRIYAGFYFVREGIFFNGIMFKIVNHSTLFYRINNPILSLKEITSQFCQQTDMLLILHALCDQLHSHRFHHRHCIFERIHCLLILVESLQGGIIEAAYSILISAKSISKSSYMPAFTLSEKEYTSQKSCWKILCRNHLMKSSHRALSICSYSASRSRATSPPPSCMPIPPCNEALNHYREES